MKKLWYKIQWLWYKRNMPKAVFRKCNDKKCRHKHWCGNLYDLELSLARFQDRYSVTVKYMCKERRISAPSHKMAFSVKKAAQLCCEENKLDAEI